MVRRLNEVNGYPDNNFTEEEYFNHIEDAKRHLKRFIQELDSMAEKEITMNDRGDYNSILTAEDESELLRRSALLHNIYELLDLRQFYY